MDKIVACAIVGCLFAASFLSGKGLGTVIDGEAASVPVVSAGE